MAIFCSLVLAFAAMDSSLAQPVLRVNQVGFLKSDRKTGVLLCNESLSDSQFSLVDLSTNHTVLRSSAHRLPGRAGSFPAAYQLDFTSVVTPGVYVIRIADVDGDTIRIQNTLYARYAEYPLEYLREQRCGENPVFDTLCHQQDGIAIGGPDDGKRIDVTGGYHDASDYLRFLITTSYVAGNLLFTYKEMPEIWTDTRDQKGHEKPNGVPDILDEARWGLEWMLKLAPKEGVLYHQVADDRDHSFWDLPYRDNTDYGWGRGGLRPVYAATGKPQGLFEFKNESNGVANIAGRSSAAFALGAMIWHDDTAFAGKLRSAALWLYALAKKSPGTSESVPCKAPYRYYEATYNDDLEWAAAELYRLTGNRLYCEEAIRFAFLAADSSWMGKDTARHYEYFPYVNLGHYELSELVDHQTKERLAGFYRSGLLAVRSQGRNNPFGYRIPLIWSSNNLAVACATQAILYRKMTGSDEFDDILFSTRDWLFGRNPWGRSFVIGVPEDGRYPRDPHSVVGRELGIRLTGALVDGPVYGSIAGSLRGLRLTHKDPLEMFQDPQAVYHDDLGDYSTNEPTLDGSESLLFLFGTFSSGEK